MPLQLTTATSSDAPQVIKLENEAYKSDILTPILFPGPFPADSSATRAEQMAQQLHDDPTTRWLKVIDTNTNEMIAFASWHVYEAGKARPPVPERTFGEGCNESACKQFWGGMDEKRQRLMGQTPHVCMLYFFLEVQLITLTRQGLIYCSLILATNVVGQEACCSNGESTSQISSTSTRILSPHLWRIAYTRIMGLRISMRWFSIWVLGEVVGRILRFTCCVRSRNDVPGRYLNCSAILLFWFHLVLKLNLVISR